MSAARQATESTPQDGNLAAMLKDFTSELSTAEIDRSNRQAENLATMKFVWHPWADVNNRGVNKNRGDIKYSVLPRMQLIPIYAWPVPVIKPAQGGFSVGSYTSYGAFMGPVGTVVSQRSMLAHESIRLIEKWYGHFGLRSLEALKAETDLDKFEAFLLYEGVMNNVRRLNPQAEDELAGETMRGVDICIEDLPAFLQNDAPQMLSYILEHGVNFTGSKLAPGFKAGFYRFNRERRTAVETKGGRMIGEMLRNVEAAIDCALNEETGILVVTRGQLAQAGMQITGAKARMDRLDEFLIKQFPSFSMDTAVERASRANQGVVSAVEGATAAQAGVTNSMLEQNRQLLEALLDMKREQNETNNRLSQIESERLANASPPEKRRVS